MPLADAAIALHPLSLDVFQKETRSSSTPAIPARVSSAISFLDTPARYRRALPSEAEINAIMV